MVGFDIAVIPVGKVETEEVEASLSRATRSLRAPVELRSTLPVPRGAEDRTRGQFRASTLMNSLRTMVPQLGPGKLIGDEEQKPSPKPDAFLFVSDVDLFTAHSDGAFSAMLPRKKMAVVSVRRLREAFYRRRADAPKQRTRLVKEIVRLAARLQGMPECTDPKCVLASSKMLADLDLKDERCCRACSQRMFEGKVKL